MRRQKRNPNRPSENSVKKGRKKLRSFRVIFVFAMLISLVIVSLTISGGGGIGITTTTKSPAPVLAPTQPMQSMPPQQLPVSPQSSP
jgi:hypothetical protein